MANLEWTEKLNYALSLSRISLQCKILEMFIKSSRYIQRCKSLWMGLQDENNKRIFQSVLQSRSFP